MLRFIVKFLLFVVILSVGALFSAQWKLKKELDSFATLVSPFMEFTYESSTLDFSGEIRVKGITIFVEAIGANIDIGEVKFFIGNLYQLAFLKSNLKKDILPKEAYLKLKNFMMPFESKLLVQMDKNTPVTSNDVLQTAFCGDVVRFGLDEYASMGYRYLAFSSETNYMLDEYSGSVILSGNFDFEEAYKTEYQMNIDGILTWIEQLKESMGSFGHSGLITPDLSLLEVRLQDQGMHLRRAEFCDKEQNSKTNYYSGHSQEVKRLMNEVGMSFNDEVLTAYQESIQPDSLQVWHFKPTVNFEFKNIADYDYQQFVESSGLKFSVNGKQVPVLFEDWSFKKFEQLLAFAKQRQDEQKVLEPAYRFIPIKQAFQQVSSRQADRYLNYRAIITRDDGKVFEGKLVKFSADKIWIKIRNDSGDVTLPVSRNQIKRLEVFKPVEEPKG